MVCEFSYQFRRTRRQVHGVEVRIVVGVIACPIEHACFLVYLAALYLVGSGLVENLDTGGADLCFRRRLGVNLVKVALHVDAIQHVVGGDAERHILVLQRSDGGSCLVGIVGDAELYSVIFLVEECSVYRAVLCRGGLRGNHCQVIQFCHLFKLPCVRVELV